MKEFVVFKGVRFVVQEVNGEMVYRDEAHLGGPWSSAIGSINNSSINLKFRKLLAKAVARLTEGKHSVNNPI